MNLKELSDKDYSRWVTPPLWEIVEAYHKLIPKFDETIEDQVKNIPSDNRLYQSFNQALISCQESPKDLTQCSEDSQHFKTVLGPYYRFWEAKHLSTTSVEQKQMLSHFTQRLQFFYSYPFLKNLTKADSSKLSARDIIDIYTLAYPIVLSEIDKLERASDMQSIWGNFIEPIISYLLFDGSTEYLEKNIDSMNFQINEIRMLWTKRNPAPVHYQKSLNYIHHHWNRMLKLVLKF